jgi:hypothetical protein
MGGGRRPCSSVSGLVRASSPLFQGMRRSGLIVRVKIQVSDAAGAL